MAAAVAFPSAVALAQVGEFTFVLAVVGTDEGILTDTLNDVILAAVPVTILLSTLTFPRWRQVLSALEASPLGDALVGGPEQPAIVGRMPERTRHVVVCGYGRTGRELVRVLQRREFAFLVVDNDPRVRRIAESERVPLIAGDAASPVVLERCNLREARLVAITFADRASAETLMREALRVNPSLDIVVRGRGADDHERFLELGASEVVHAELEAGLEFVRHTLRRFGLPRQEVDAIIARRRAEFFRAPSDRIQPSPLE